VLDVFTQVFAQVRQLTHLDRAILGQATLIQIDNNVPVNPNTLHHAVITPRLRTLPPLNFYGFIASAVDIKLWGTTLMTPRYGLSISAIRKNAMDEITGRTSRARLPLLRSR